MTPMSRGCLAVLIGLLCAAPAGFVRVAAQDVGTEAQRESGKKLYLKYCSQCHGEQGDGEGYAAPHLRPRPRNFIQQLRSVGAGLLEGCAYVIGGIGDMMNGLTAILEELFHL